MATATGSGAASINSKVESMNKDPDVEALYRWTKSMRLSSDQYNTLCAIVSATVQHKLQAFTEAIMNMSVEDLQKEQSDMRLEKMNKTGLWEVAK